MDLYSNKQRWKLVLALVALGIVGASLWYSRGIVERVRTEERKKVGLWAEAVRSRAQLVNYTDSLFKRLREEDHKKMELWADAQTRLTQDNANDLSFYLRVVSDNTTVPVIITDERGDMKFARNLDKGVEESPAAVRRVLAHMKKLHDPIEIPIGKDMKQYLYYMDSRVVTELATVMARARVCRPGET